MRLAELPVRRPVATAMFFAALLLLGAVAWRVIPVELFPDIEGDELYVSFSRPGSEPETVERELLRPLESRIASLPGLAESWGTITGDSGRLRIRFEPGADLDVRDLDLRRIASDLERSQPRGSRVEVTSASTEFVSRFVMVVQLSGPDDRNALRDVAEDQISPRLAAVPGVSAALVYGGAPRELRIAIDPDRAAEVGVFPSLVADRLRRAIAQPRFAGTADGSRGRTSVVVDGRPGGLRSLARLRVGGGANVQLRHVARVEMRPGEETQIARVDGRPVVTLLLFKQAEANLVQVGRDLRARMQALEREFAPLGLRFTIDFDGAQEVEDQLHRLERLALSGFLIALLVLLLFLRQVRPVAVVALSVPASLVTGIALLYLAGQSVNLITLFGLAVGIGMLVDNSIVVYEAVQRRLERGAEADAAAIDGVSYTARAILAATLTNAVVFVPLLFAEFELSLVRRLLEVMALAYLLPLAGSLIVAFGLVPLLARRLAAPAALARIARERARRAAHAGLPAPSRGRELFGALLTVALRRPGAWLAATVVIVLLSAFAGVTWVGVSLAGRQAPGTDEVRVQVELPPGLSLDRAGDLTASLEATAREIGGVERVTSLISETEATLTIRLEEEETRPPGVDAAGIRARLTKAARELPGVEVRDAAAPGRGGGGEGGEGGGLAEVLGQAPAQVTLSGPDARRLWEIGRQIEQQLEAIPEVAWASIGGRQAGTELWVEPDRTALSAVGLTEDQILPALTVLRREGFALPVGITEQDGREIPVVLRREGRADRAALEQLRLETPAGVLPLTRLASIRRMTAPPAIRHHDGRLELAVSYRLSQRAPQVGPERDALERRLRAAIASVHLPPGYTIEPPAQDQGTRWFRTIFAPVVLLLYGVLAVTFESLVLPLLVLVALPLTLVGAVVALLLAGIPADMMAFVGALALLGLTVNPAILLIDRMQQRVRAGRIGPGAAALAAVRERARPVLMTTATTVAGLWPLALSTGEENEIWPPFATVVMGGLATATLLTLLVIPAGFVLLRRLDALFGRLGPWVTLGWLGATAAVLAPLFWSGLVASLTWQIVTALLVAAGWLGLAVLLAPREPPPRPRAEPDRPPPLEVRFLHKTYGEPGPVARALRAPEAFAERVLARGGRPFDPADARARILPRLAGLAGALYLALSISGGFWRLAAGFAAAALAAGTLLEVRRARGRADAVGRVLPGGPEGLLAACAPWAVVGVVAWRWLVIPAAEGTLSAGPQRAVALVLLALSVLFVQAGRRTAVAVARGDRALAPRRGRWRRARRFWRGIATRLFGFDLPRREVRALRDVWFRAERGMIGILGPNGAGKTTLLRQVAGMFEPTRGVIRLGSVPLPLIRRRLAEHVGYLPQEFGLPLDMTAREYLDYFAILYGVGDRRERRARVDRLLEEVGLASRADERIGGFSGGMRQRVAVARTLLRLPPVIVVDEPTVGLDPRERIRFRNLLARLAAGRIVLFSTHVVEDVAVACERVIVLAGGRIVFDGAPAGLEERARGRVFELDVGPEEAEGIEARVVDRLPLEDGRVRLRIIAAEGYDDPRARPAEATLQDGYLLLVSAAGAEAAA